MSTLSLPLKNPAVVYPESDGLPLADNTKQFRWIMTIQGGLDEALTSAHHYEEAEFVPLLK